MKQENELPFNIEAEQILLGCLLNNNEDYHKISDIINENHFYEPVHSRIFIAISKFVNKGILANAVTLKGYFENDPALINYNGAAYLATICGSISIFAEPIEYAKTIYELSVRRQLIDFGKEVIRDSYQNDIEKDLTDQLEVIEQKLFKIASSGNSNNEFKKLSYCLDYTLNHAETAMKNKDKLSGVTTGYIDLDKLLGGLNNSDLLILAGRPSMGKTAFAVNLALNSADYLANNKLGSVGFFSLEMSAEQLGARILSMESGISATQMRSGCISADDFRLLARANKKLQGINLFIDDTPALSIGAIRARARRLKRKYNLQVLFIDYLQLIKGSGKASSLSNRVNEVSEVTQGLKAIAKELNIPVIALSQLSRAVEQREDKRPQLSDLRESGSIEQDADIVMFIYREEYYLMRQHKEEGSAAHHELLEKLKKIQNQTEILIAKQRNGPIGNINLFFDSNTSKFKNSNNSYFN